MDRPVGSPLLTELPGAVERIDDPHSVRRQAGGIVLLFLGDDRIIRAMRVQLPHQMVGGLAITAVTSLVGVGFRTTNIKQ